MLRKITVAICALLLAAGMVSIVGPAASAHAGNMTVSATCNKDTGQYDVTYTLNWTNAPGGGGTGHYRLGENSFINGWTYPGGKSWTDFAINSGSGSKSWTQSLPGTTTNGPWTYAYIEWSDGYNQQKVFDTRVEGLAGNCTKSFDKHVETVCWLMPDNLDPATTPTAGAQATFPQARVSCGDPIPCGRWVQKDVYHVNDATDEAVWQGLGDTLEWKNGKPEDNAIYYSHTFIKGPQCEAPKVFVCKYIDGKAVKTEVLAKDQGDDPLWVDGSECTPPPPPMCKNKDMTVEYATSHGYFYDEETGDCYKKVYVCKYVKGPGDTEVPQTGNNPINVSANALKDKDGNPFPGTLPWWFADAQGRSVAFQWAEPGNQDNEPGVEDCPPPPTVDICKWVDGHAKQVTVAEGAQGNNPIWVNGLECTPKVNVCQWIDGSAHQVSVYVTQKGNDPLWVDGTECTPKVKICVWNAETKTAGYQWVYITQQGNAPLWVNGSECTPSKVVEWHVWQITGDCDIAVGEDGKSVHKTGLDCDTPWPQDYVQPYDDTFQPEPCIWYQVDKYEAWTHEQIAQLWADGKLVYVNGHPEDSNLVKDWFFIYGGDDEWGCEPPVQVCDTETWQMKEISAAEYNAHKETYQLYDENTCHPDYVCPNLGDKLTEIPDGYYVDRETGDCYVKVKVCVWDAETQTAGFEWVLANRQGDRPLYVDGSECTPNVNICVWDDQTKTASSVEVPINQIPEGAKLYKDGTECTPPNIDASLLQPVCDSNAPFIDIDVNLFDPGDNSTDDGTIDLKFWDNDGHEYWINDIPLDGDFMAHILWPGATISDNGDGTFTATGWPGWDYVDGAWVSVGDDNFGWTREGAFVTVYLNPEKTFDLAYPDPTWECGNPPPPQYICEYTEGDATGHMVTIEYGEEVPEGAIPWVNGDECTPDVCPNITGNQPLVPEGMLLYGEKSSTKCAVPPTLAGTILSSVCQSDVPWIEYDITLNDPDDVSTDDGFAHFTFTAPSHPGESYTVDIPLDPSGHTAGHFLWPGAAILPDGTANGWPGWALVDGEWVSIGLDNFGWTRDGVTVKLEINPEMSVSLSYPPPTAACVAGPPTEVHGELDAPPADAVEAEAQYAG